MQFILRAFINSEQFEAFARAAGRGRAALASGLCDSCKPFFGAALAGRFGQKPVFVVSDEGRAAEVSAALYALFGRESVLLAGRDFIFRNIENVSRQQEERRLASLIRLLNGDFCAAVLTADTLVQPVTPPEKLRGLIREIKAGEEFPLSEAVRLLSECGYERCEMVEGHGQFSVRGGILDFYPPLSEYPVRVEFFGDTPDLIGEFDPMTQRRVNQLQSAVVTPALEVLLGEQERRNVAAFLRRAIRRFGERGAQKTVALLGQDLERIESGLRFAAADKYLPVINPRLCTALGYLSDECRLFLIDTPRCKEAMRAFVWRVEEDIRALAEEDIPVAPGDYALPLARVYPILGERGAVMLETFTHAENDIPVDYFDSFATRQTAAFSKNTAYLAEDVKSALKRGFAVAVLAGSPGNVRYTAQSLLEQGVKAQETSALPQSLPEGGVFVLPGALAAGFEADMALLAVFSAGAAEPARISRRPSRGARKGEKIHSFSDIRPGDYVVHEGYGIGIYEGIHKVEVDGVIKDFLKIRYAGTDTLYIPVGQLDLISKYVGASSDVKLKLNRLGGGEWQRQKLRVRQAVADLAKELIRLYAERSATKGFAFSPDSEWQREFEEKFEYAETDDQLRCAAEIKRDMERPFPMDRLLCGDVGFGKTEVALRALFKCVLDGKQAVLLVPTTILAWQHYNTILRRMEGYPVKVELLSRFRTAAQQEEILRRLRRGELDILVGTHRLLQKDVVFKDLGLVIIDEEQRFGVMHKERLTEMTRAVDVLSLSATPIPRTLNMALSGIKDMSVIEEPPAGRHPVTTYVLEYDAAVIADAVRREAARGGQAYYLHNRVESLGRIAAKLAARCPGLRIATAHGQMGEGELSSVWERLINGEVDMLVCTTIIETGVDVPNVNTLIVEDADRLGLAQLHQIRGRVGRSARRAYAYFTYRRGKVLTEDAYKRLSAIREFTEFGSGLKLALRDLEIRGAGNILGPQQHGHMQAVGYDMYLKLLDEAVRELKGEEKRPERCVMDLSVEAYLPEDYIESGLLRIEAYKRIASIESEEDAQDVTDELIDRFGEPPGQVTALIDIARAKALATACGIAEISQKSDALLIYPRSPDMRIVSALSVDYRRRLMFSAAARPYISLILEKGTDTLRALMDFLLKYREAGLQK